MTGMLWRADRQHSYYRSKNSQFIGFMNGDAGGYNETIEGKSGDTSVLKKAPKEQIIDRLS